MPRYIDADALRKQISETYEYEFPTASGGFDEFATKIIPNIINNAITADVVPVVRGEWVKSDDYKGWLVCSACRDCYVDNAWVNGKKWRYCPNCGALMEDKPLEVSNERE